MKNNKRKNPSYKLKVRLLQEVKLKCPFCGHSDASKLEHHHIDGDSSNTIFENLISVCPNCHSEIESKKITLNQILEIKKNVSITSGYFNKNSYTFENFRIHKNRVGIINKGMRIKDIYSILPQNQIRKIVTLGEHSGEDMYDSYEIYNSDGEHILTLGTSENDTFNDAIKSVSIHSSKFCTLTNLRIGISLSEFLISEQIKENSPDIDFIHFNIEWIDAVCSISKKQLIEGWWNSETNTIELKDENLEAKVDLITILW